VGEVAEAEGGSAEVLEATVDGLGGSVRRAGAVEVGEHVAGAFGQSATEAAELDERLRDSVAERFDDRGQGRRCLAPVGFAVGGDHALVDAPGRFNLDVLVDREQRVESCALLVGEQACAGVQGSPRSVQRVVAATTMPMQVALDPPPALIQRITGQPHHVERVHHGDSVRELFGGGGLETGEPVHRHHLQPAAPQRVLCF